MLRPTLHLGLLVAVLQCLSGTNAKAQSRSVPSHGKIQLDSYNLLLGDVHPASQAQTNYLLNRQLGAAVRKTERLERQERLDAYGERQRIKKLQGYDTIARRLSAGCPTSASSLAPFWILISVYGDRAEVYDALSSAVSPIPHDNFVPTSKFIMAVQPTSELEPPPFVLSGAAGVDFSRVEFAWRAVAKDMRPAGRVAPHAVANFHEVVADYRRECADTITEKMPAGGRVQAKTYLESLAALADALYRPEQSAQIQRYIEQEGYAFNGQNMLELMQHMLRNRVTPVHGSTAQLALAEVARPISRVLEQEIALHLERIDSLAAGKGHRPYSTEYRAFKASADSMASTQK